jgi:hypothetical protein
MRSLKALGLAALIAMAALPVVGAGPASATVFCEAKEETCSGPKWQFLPTIEGKASGLTLLGTIGEKCNSSSLEGEATEEPEVGKGSLAGSIVVLTMTGECEPCTAVTATGLPYATSMTATEAVGDGKLTVKGLSLKLTGCPLGVSCVFNASEISANLTGGGPASLAVTEAALTFLEGSKSFCGSTAKLDATYEVTAPKPIFVSKDVKPATLCKVEPEEVKGDLVCPTGKGLSGKFEGKLAEGTEAEFKSIEGPSGTIDCSESSFTAEFNENGKSPAGGGFTALSFGAVCTSTLLESPEVEVEAKGLPYDNSALTYQQPGLPQGVTRIQEGNTVLFELRLSGPLGAVTCRYTRDRPPRPPLGTLNNGNPSQMVVNYKLLLQSEMPTEFVCPMVLEFSVTYVLGPNGVYIAR